jgi:superfamily II DNA/RNA helicase
VDGIDLVIHADPPAEHKAYLHRSGRTGRAGAGGVVVVTLQTPAQAGDVRALMRKACVVPLAATVRPGSALPRSIAGKPAQPPAPQPHPAAAARETAATATLVTGRGAAAASARYHGRRRR